jgi:hypothetical protein
MEINLFVPKSQFEKTVKLARLKSLIIDFTLCDWASFDDGILEFVKKAILTL